METTNKKEINEIKLKNFLKKLIKSKKEEEKDIKIIEKEYKIKICGVTDEHFILKKINKKIKTYILVDNYSDIIKISKYLFGENWFDKYKYYDDYYYIIIDDIMLYYI